jgi:hypothetical protein
MSPVSCFDETSVCVLAKDVRDDNAQQKLGEETRGEPTCHMRETLQVAKFHVFGGKPPQFSEISEF